MMTKSVARAMHAVTAWFFPARRRPRRFFIIGSLGFWLLFIPAWLITKTLAWAIVELVLAVVLALALAGDGIAAVTAPGVAAMRARGERRFGA